MHAQGSTLGKSLRGLLRDAYFGSAPMRLAQPGSTPGASRFVNALIVVIDGRSHLLAEPSPFAAPYSPGQRLGLLVRASLGDRLATGLLRANYRHFYQTGGPGT